MNEDYKEVDEMMANMGVAEDDPDVLAMYENIEVNIAEEDFNEIDKNAGEFVPAVQNLDHHKEKEVEVESEEEEEEDDREVMMLA